MPMLCSHEGGGAWPGGVGGIVPGPLGGSLFGNGRPYGNISGAATYDAVTGTWTVTGAATVDISSETGTAVLMCRKIIVTSAGVLTVTTNCKGLLIFASASAEVQAGGKIHIDKLGKAGNFGDLTPYDLLPSALKYLSRGKLSRYIIKGEGALGGLAMPASTWPVPTVGNAGSNGSAMQTGGGGTGLKINTNSAVGGGGKGGPCCGGASSAGGQTSGTETPAAGDYGGPGSSATYTYTSGGNGDPVGTAPGGNGIGAGGGLLCLFTPKLIVNSGAVISADGAKGAGGVGTAPVGAYPSGGAGGGCLVVVTNSGGYTNAGTVQANGGAPTSSTYNGATSGAGGAGSVNIFTA